VFSSILSKTKIHVSIVKGYHLPSDIDVNTLVIVTSISGNTVETLSALNCAKENKCKIIGFSSGGKLEDFCRKFQIEHICIPTFHSPRASFSVFLYSMIKVLFPILPISKNDVYNSITKLENLKKCISSSNLKNNQSLEIADWIKGIPLIYYPFGLQAAATRFKNSLHENSKQHAMIEDVVEASHNNIVAWEKSLNIQPILLCGIDDYSKTKERWVILKEYFNSNSIEYKEIISTDGHILSKLINLIYLLDYASIYHAILSGIDPSPIKSIDFIKDRL